MNTPEQQQIAAEVGIERDRDHVAWGDKPRTITRKRSRADINRLGLLGEFAYCNVFGGEPDLSFRRAGDGGTDFRLSGLIVDIKVTTYTGANAFIRVPHYQLRAARVFVAGVYDNRRDQVDLAGWVWGHEVVARNERVAFNERGVVNYVYPITSLRSIEDLRRYA